MSGAHGRSEDGAAGGAGARYTPFHPRWHRERVSTYWWLWRGPYLKFVLREISSLFVAWSVVLTLLWVGALRSGPEASASLRAWLARPHVLALDAATLFFLVFHSVTWFNLAPRAMVVHLRGKRVPDGAISGANYLAWAAATAVVAWVVLRAG